MKTWAVVVAVVLLAGGAGAEPPDSKDVRREAASGAAFDAGRKWAVVIGVNAYGDPGIPALRYCVADARLVAKTLQDDCGYPAGNILLMTTSEPETHRRPNKFCEGRVKEWLAQAQPGDTVLFFFSGHGFRDESGDQGFLALEDTEKANLGLTSLRTDNIRDYLRQCRATQKLLVLDCCHSGGDKDVERAGPSSEEMATPFGKAEGLLTLASCGKSEVSLEWDEK
jgi:uncharacterized caspase-like protein